MHHRPAQPDFKPARHSSRQWPPHWLRTEPEGSRLAQRPLWQPSSWQRALIGLIVIFFIAPLVVEQSRAQSDAESVGTGTLLFRTDDRCTAAIAALL